jgi:hypothetical protein
MRIESRVPFILNLVLDGGVFLLLYMMEIRLAIQTEQEGGWPPTPVCSFGKVKSEKTLRDVTRIICFESHISVIIQTELL